MTFCPCCSLHHLSHLLEELKWPHHIQTWILPIYPTESFKVLDHSPHLYELSLVCDIQGSLHILSSTYHAGLLQNYLDNLNFNQKHLINSSGHALHCICHPTTIFLPKWSLPLECPRRSILLKSWYMFGKGRRPHLAYPPRLPKMHLLRFFPRLLPGKLLLESVFQKQKG